MTYSCGRTSTRANGAKGQQLHSDPSCVPCTKWRQCWSSPQWAVASFRFRHTNRRTSAGCGTPLQTSAVHARKARIALARRVVQNTYALIPLLTTRLQPLFSVLSTAGTSWPHDIAAGRFEPSRPRSPCFFGLFVAVTVWPCPIFASKEAQKKPSGRAFRLRARIAPS